MKASKLCVRRNRIGFICIALFLGACSHAPKELPGEGRMLQRFQNLPAVGKGGVDIIEACQPTSEEAELFARDRDIADVKRIPQRLEELPAIASGSVAIPDHCRGQLVDRFRTIFFTPWTSKSPLFDPSESKEFMKREARGNWHGVNNRKVPAKLLQPILHNCALESFPSRSDAAIAVAPGHLRGLPTLQPLYEPNEGAPFDMLSYPQVKLNEPLRVLHVSRDGSWFFVESAYSNGWIETRDVAFVDAAFIASWMEAPQAVIVRDATPVADGRGVAVARAKLGTILPLAGEEEKSWQISVASAGEGGKAEVRQVTVAREAAARFPLDFTGGNLALIGNQMLGQPYGWGEIYDLRDCSALLRDFFMPFGIWLPRTSGDQIASVRDRIELASLSPTEKEEQIKKKGVPFLTLLYKKGHIMLYAGLDQKGRPLVFHDSWSIRVKDNDGERTQITGIAAITTLEPGKELGLARGWSLLEKAKEMGTITGRCK